MKPRSLALALLLAGFWIGVAVAQGKKVTITGCPYPGVVATCLMIKDKDGTVYNITGANPKPVPGDVAIVLTGTVAQKVSICMQGAILDDIKWDRTKMRCP